MIQVHGSAWGPGCTGFDRKPGDVVNCPRVCIYISIYMYFIYSACSSRSFEYLLQRSVATYRQCETVDRAVAVWSMISYRSGKQK